MTSLEHRWGFLAPWCEELKGNLYYGRLAVKGGVWDTQRNTLHVVIKRHFRGVNVTVEEETFLLKLRKIRESLALLAAVEYVDPVAWKFLLTTYCGIDVGKEGEEQFDDAISVKFLLSLEFEEENDDLVKFCGVDQRDNPSEEYLDTLAKIATLAERLQPDWRGVEIQIPVHVFFSTDRTKAMDASARELMNIKKAEDIILEEWREYSDRLEVQIVAPGSLRCTFVLEPAVVDFLGMNLSASMVKAVETLVRGNFWFSQVKRMRLELGKELWDDELESKKVFGQLLNGLFSSTRRSRELPNPKNRSSFDVYNPQTNALQLERVQLFFPSSMPAADFVAAASAIAISQTVKKLELSLITQSLPQITIRLWWTWLAYALFSKRAHSSLECIEIVKVHHVTIADMEKFTQVLSAEHPEEKLFDSPHGESEEKLATLARGATIRWQFNYRGEPLPGFEPLLFPFSVPSVLTFSDDGVSEWVNVLIPGYGRGQVQRVNLQFRESSEVKANTRLKSLKIGFNNESNSITNGIPLLLTAVGHSLNRLTLDGRNLDIDICTILRSCPNLVELSLCGAVADVLLKFGNYCGLLQPFSEVDLDWNNVIALSQTLSNDNNPLAKCVHHLRVRPVSDAELNALLDMLKQNLTLKYVEITIPAQFQRHIESFRKFNLQPTHHTMKLSLKSKAAFISAVEENQTGSYQQRSPVSELSQELLCKIFTFAVSPVRRQVFVRSEHAYVG